MKHLLNLITDLIGRLRQMGRVTWWWLVIRSLAFSVLSLTGVWKREIDKCQRENIVVLERDKMEKINIYFVNTFIVSRQ